MCNIGTKLEREERAGDHVWFPNVHVQALKLKQKNIWINITIVSDVVRNRSRGRGRGWW